MFFLPSAAVPQALERLDGVVEAVRQYAQVGWVGRALGGSAAVALVGVVDWWWWKWCGSTGGGTGRVGRVLGGSAAVR